jgi:hypothetical protein
MDDDSFEDEARRFLDHVENCIRGALSPENSKILTSGDRGELERALYRLRPSFDELAKWFINPSCEIGSGHPMYGYEKLWHLLSATFVGGSCGIVTESHKKFHDAERTSLARAGRDRPEILEAILAVHGHNNPAEHPYAVAGSILGPVNTWLTDHGHDPVLVDALARKIPHT